MSKEKENLKVVLIDDEDKSRLILKKLIEEYIENTTVIAMASDVLEGVKVIQQYNPDVVFLDIEMPNYSGFKLVEYFDETNFSNEDSSKTAPPQFEIVFTTAYEKYAMKAYKVAAIGYLLKPIDIDELIDIFKKIDEKRKENKHLQNGRELVLENSKRIIFPTQNGLIYLYQAEICYLESSGRYTNIYLVNNKHMLSTLSLKDCGKKLADATFIRIHRSFIINLTYIKNYSRGRDSFVVLDNGSKVDVGLFYKEDLNTAISYFLK